MPGPMGMPPGMSMMPPDPMQAMLMALAQNPELLDELLGANGLPLDREKWQEPKKPTEGQMLERVRAGQRRLMFLNRRFDQDLQRINYEVAGVFEDHDEDVELVFRSVKIAQDDQLIASIVGTIEPIYASPRMRPTDEDEAQAKEDFLHFMHNEMKRQHARAGHSDLNMDACKTVTRYGRIVTQSLCAFKKRPGMAPFRMRLIDPAIIYPTFAGGDRGMTHATLVYHQRLADFVGFHDTDGKLEARLQDFNLLNEKTGSPYQLNDYVEVMEYWDCKWYALFVSGKLVEGPIDHNYGEPPFTYTLAPYGDPNYTRSPDQTQMFDQDGFTVSQEDADLARRGLSHHASQFLVEAQREAMLGKALTEFSKWGDEPIYIAQGQMTYNVKQPQLSRAKGTRNYIDKDNDEIIRLPDPPVPPSMPILMQAIAEDAARGGMSPNDYGLNPAAQTSGYAIAGLSEQGHQKLAPVKRTLELHYAQVGEQILRLYRDWGHLLGDDGQRGSIAVPRSFPDALEGRYMWTLTPAMVDRSGMRVECHLTDTPDVATLGNLANALKLLGDQGIIRRSDKIRMAGLPGSQNPTQVKRDVDLEALDEMPQKKLADLLEYVSVKLKDPKKADFIASQIAQGGAPGGSGPAGPPGLGAGAPSGPPEMGGGSPANAQGLSLPGMNMAPGTQGGRPQGGPAPPPPNKPPGPGTEY